MAHWSDAYIGDPYIPGTADCARLFCRVSREVFGVEIPDEAEVSRAASRIGRAGQMDDAVLSFGEPVETPAEGDAVLMICAGRPSHIGAYCWVDGEPGVVHAMENAGMTVRHALRDLPRYGLRVEGYYRWK
jgi:hypothetical protein